MAEFSEELARALFEDGATALAIVDLGTLVPLETNPTLLRWTGLSQQQLLNTSIDQFLELDDGDFVEQLRSKRTHSCPFQGTLQLADGGQQSVEVVILPAPQKASLAILILRQSSQLREPGTNDPQHEEAEQAIVQRLEAVGRLSSGVAHELNNLMTIALGCIDQLEHTVPEEAFKAVDVLKQVVTQGATLARSLLRFGHPIPPKRRRIDLRDVVQQGLRVLRETFGQNIQVTLTGEWKQPVLADADASQLQQVLMNLGLNARDAMPAGGQLEVRLERDINADDGDPWIALSVIDSGCGIAPENIARMFEPFVTHKGGEGVGLGLAVVRDIVEAHDGMVEVQSQLGQGTTVRILLPGVVSEPAPPPAVQPPFIPEKNVALLAQSPQYNREIVASTLEAMGMRAICASDSAELATCLEAHQDKLAVLVIDWTFLEVEGFKVPDDVPALLLSREPAAGPPLEQGRRVLNHPFRLADFRRCIEELLS